MLPAHGNIAPHLYICTLALKVHNVNGTFYARDNALVHNSKKLSAVDLFQHRICGGWWNRASCPCRGFVPLRYVVHKRYNRCSSLSSFFFDVLGKKEWRKTKAPFTIHNLPAFGTLSEDTLSLSLEALLRTFGLWKSLHLSGRGKMSKVFWEKSQVLTWNCNLCINCDTKGINFMLSHLILKLICLPGKFE